MDAVVLDVGLVESKLVEELSNCLWKVELVEVIESYPMILDR